MLSSLWPKEGGKTCFSVTFVTAVQQVIVLKSVITLWLQLSCCLHHKGCWVVYTPASNVSFSSCSVVLQSADCGLCAVRRTVVERYLTFEKQKFADFYISKGQSATVKCKMHQSIILLTQHRLFANICWGTRSQACSIVDFISTFTCLYGGITVGTLKSLWTGFKPLFALC